MQNTAELKHDFDLIACLPPYAWDHNRHYHRYVLKNMPRDCKFALEIGCGTGEFTRLLAKKASTATGVDISPNMVEKAKSSSIDKNIKYANDDFSTMTLKNNSYDFIVSLATFHHMSFEACLLKCSELLKSGGVLAVLDLYQMESIFDHLISLVAVPLNRIICLLKTGSFEPSLDYYVAWTAHAKNDRYMTFDDIKRLAKRLLPNVRVRRHLFFRYSLVWRKE